MAVKCHAVRNSKFVYMSKKELLKELLKELYIPLKKFLYMIGFKEMEIDKIS